MKKLPLLILTLLILSGLSQAQLAFPGAEGFGRFATGGRGGEVYHVTNLNDSGPGSLRDAVSKSNRIVVFDVGGVINIGERIVIQRNITIAGQTAPGGGITIYGNGVALNSSSGNLIMRYIRIRMGDQGDSRKDALGISDGQNYMFDNVSVAWGWDGTVDVNGTNIDNITFQDCIISQGIDIVGHSTGGLVQSGKWSIIRSLYIDNETRNPKGKGTHEFINNVVYSWGSNGYIMGATSNIITPVNCVGNWFIYGPNSSSGSHITRTTPEVQVYGRDNWVDDNKNGVLDALPMTDYKTATVMSVPFDYHGMNNVMPADEALQYVIDNVGGSFPARDAVDEYLIDELLSYGTKGGVIVRESENGIPFNVGVVANGTPPADTDRDGMPDMWETERGLNPNVADDKGDDDNDGYTNIEEYLSCLVGEGDACSFNPRIDCNGDLNGTAYLDECSICVAGNTGFTPCYKDCNGDKDGTASFDECGVCSGGNTGVQACLGAIQGEDFCSADGVSESSNSGFIGDGYLNLLNVNGSSATWYIVSEIDQTVSIDIRYANGGGSARGMNVIVNGSVQAPLQGSDTGGWTNWTSETISLNLLQGVNSITLTATDAGGGPNIDILLFNTTGLSSTSCSADCNGDIGGIASVDECGICTGGNTGKIACTDETTQKIELISGWNLISTNVYPVDSTIETLFSGLDVSLIKDANGFWKSGQVGAFNSLQTITAGNGYLVYMNNAGTLQITGNSVQTPLMVSLPGWNLIGYPGCADAINCVSIPFSTYFNTTNCTIIKNFEGFWEPNGSSNSIEDLEPGKGYYIKK
ncbi:MAG: hypothetical protein PF481_02265 [Bacteroidales bacterium]|jgi:hypothetical protein|nr:hypothetical protein [Bacteroidales bacterium]